MEAMDCISYQGYRIEIVGLDCDAAGYQIYDPDGIIVEDRYNLSGSDCFIEPDGPILQECRDVIDEDIAAARTVQV